MDEKKKSNKGFIIVGPETGERKGERHCVRLTPDGPETGTIVPGWNNPAEGSRRVVAHARGPILKVEELSEPYRSPVGAPKSGPAKVTTDEYRDGWNLIWGKREVAQA